ncbi:MAG: hypothetical protein MJZ18_08025, partial [Bacteroidales bacterium]|nr:hypothetical protein [Bacteroidales bacterium]
MKKLLLCNLFVWLLLANVMSQNTITPVMPPLNGSTYLIENAGNMHWLNENWINADVYESSIKGKSFRVSQENMNIDLGEWHSNINLATKFEGNNSTFTFTSSSDNATSATGLFLTLTDCAQVQDVHVVADIYASTNTTPVGILCNRIVSSKSTLTEQIEIQVYDVITDGYIHSSPFEAGAIAGTSEAYTDIRRCFNKATVESCRAAGGIVGAVLQKTRNFTLSSTGNIGIVKAICTKYDQQLDAGGLLGYIEEVDGMASISECYNRGTI